MNMQALRGVDQLGGEPIADDAFEQDGAGDIGVRAARAAGVAAANATDVDRHGRFPREAFEVIKTQRLLSLGVPKVFGGDGAPIGDLADVCYTLGKACSSTGMIYAMHLTKVACIVRHGRGQEWHEALMRAIARDQLLLASSTTEGNNGGNVRSSAAPVTRDGGTIDLERAATVISYGAEADGLVTTARRSADAASSDQVLVAFLKSDYTLERLNGWDTLGMRGTCSSGFKLCAKGSAEQVLPERYETIHAQTMTPYAHILWASVWAGIAAGAVEKAQKFIRHVSRQAGGQMPPGSGRYSQACASLRSARAQITSVIDRYETAQGDADTLDSIGFQNAISMLKVDVSELAVATVMSAMRACGLSGYREDGDFSIGRSLRDILSSPIMIHNDRIIANAATASLMAAVPGGLRG
jgi:acyl-CoA dehydrogenase